MSTNPPVLDSSLPSNDAQEWANNTTAAIDHNLTEDPPTADTPAQKAAATDEQDVPGSFPPTPPVAGAGGVFGSAQKGVQDVFRKASETAKPYLPESLVTSSSIPASNSPALPAKEVPSGSVVGVGSSPGQITEPAAVKLPEDRAEETSGSAGSATGTNPFAPKETDTGTNPFAPKETTAETGPVASEEPTPGTSPFAVKEPVPATSPVAPKETTGISPFAVKESAPVTSPVAPKEPSTETSPFAPKETTTSGGVFETTQQTLNNAGQTAKQYLPKGVADLLPGPKAKKGDLPSTEVPSGSPVGVGSLPGTTSEVSVAKLPEERRQEGLPSHETDHEVLGKTGGVGPLPGGPDESKVALLPEERIHPAEEILRSASGGAQDTTPITTTTNTLAAPIAAPPTQKGATTAHAIDRSHISEPPTPIGKAAGGLESTRLGSATTTKPEKPKPETKTQKVTEEVQDVKSKVASVLPGHTGPQKTTQTTAPAATSGAPDTSTTPPTTSETSGGAGTAPAPASQTTGTSERRESAGSSTGAHHKVGFLDKVKGEAMIIQGKLAKNEKKIEEGRHLMGKQ